MYEIFSRLLTGNMNLEYFASSCPVNMFQQSTSPELYDIVGNVWQWNETPMHPYDHFKVHPLYDDFTTPTYDTQHNLIKGGSWVSTGNEATKDSRCASAPLGLMVLRIAFLCITSVVLVLQMAALTCYQLIPFCVCAHHTGTRSVAISSSTPVSATS